MANKTDIINIFLKESQYKAIAKRIAGKLWEDLYQEVCIGLLEMNEDKLVCAFEKSYFKPMIIRMMQNITYNRTRKNSSLYSIVSNSDEFFEIDNLLDNNIYSTAILFDILEKKLEKDEQTKFYSSKLLRQYLKHGSCRKTAKATGIPYNSIAHDVHKYIREIQPELIEELKLLDIEKI